MRPTLGLRKGENLYQDLKHAAATDLLAKKRLDAIHETLDYFDIKSASQRNVTAEAVLRLEKLQDRSNGAMHPDTKDKLAVAMFRVTAYFQKLCRQ